MIYINDLYDLVKKCKTGSFADDTNLKGKIDKSTLLNELPFTAEYAETSEYRYRQTIHGTTI